MVPGHQPPSPSLGLFYSASLYLTEKVFDSAQFGGSYQILDLPVKCAARSGLSYVLRQW